MYNYDDVLVTLLADVATNYVTVRTTQKRIKLLEANIELQRGVLKYIENRFKVGYKVTELDLDQAISNLRQTEAGIPQLEISLRQAENRLCILLGMPPADLSRILGDGPIPTSPTEVAVGIPADLVRRRPDVRKAEREAAAQAEEIGIAESDLYPAFYINGNFGYSANKFSSLFRETALNGSFGPTFNWKLLNYGRIANDIRYQEERFRELAIAYQNIVLSACEEVENGLVQYLRSEKRTALLDESVIAARKAVKIVIAQYEKGGGRFQPLRHDRAESCHAAGLGRAGPGTNRPGIDRGLSGAGRRMGVPVRRSRVAGCVKRDRPLGARGRSASRHGRRSRTSVALPAGLYFFGYLLSNLGALRCLC